MHSRPLPPSHDDTTRIPAINFPTHASSRHPRSVPLSMQILAPLHATVGTNNTETTISTFQHHHAQMTRLTRDTMIAERTGNREEKTIA
ncbi:hypothetical protein Hypma_013576 [Hypsizygus marmoreus]|uniref:Uncharacterized protein n=1 Tax=Hypsizygus marmoreus TaxID=39966 RepID=A0A369JD07_HYPMA|nr:hypothetical protein Hypma_013576 [Hypsizygus marmoreus]